MTRCGAQEMKFYSLRKSGTNRSCRVTTIHKGQVRENKTTPPVGWVERIQEDNEDHPRTFRHTNALYQSHR